ncbi:MAG: hypothetical protein EZS28_040217 [Streblomastix strix]|uniref:Uncharacterized protein n=1 Tax=Streblomastix strix TaxID=222440 RepID=A0A5J4U0M3_9EUKA|nr:MAG: hypothetical protein EZS28_040217 [Streblomastix strix]
MFQLPLLSHNALLNAAASVNDDTNLAKDINQNLQQNMAYEGQQPILGLISNQQFNKSGVANLQTENADWTRQVLNRNPQLFDLSYYLSPISRMKEFYKQFGQTYQPPPQELMIFLIMEFLQKNGFLSTLKVFQQETDIIFRDEDYDGLYDAEDGLQTAYLGYRRMEPQIAALSSSSLGSPQFAPKQVDKADIRDPLLEIIVGGAIRDSEKVHKMVNNRGEVDVEKIKDFLRKTELVKFEEQDKQKSIWDPSSSDEDITYSNEDQKDNPLLIEMATFDKLVENITMPGLFDENRRQFIKSFLIMYPQIPKYDSPLYLFAKLRQRFHVPERVIAQIGRE